MIASGVLRIVSAEPSASVRSDWLWSIALLGGAVRSSAGRQQAQSQVVTEVWEEQQLVVAVGTVWQHVATCATRQQAFTGAGRAIATAIAVAKKTLPKGWNAGNCITKLLQA